MLFELQFQLNGWDKVLKCSWASLLKMEKTLLTGHIWILWKLSKRWKFIFLRVPPSFEGGFFYWKQLKYKILIVKLCFFTNQFFIGERTIYLGGIKERDSAFHCFADQCNHIFFVGDSTISKAHAHSTESKGWYFQPTIS